MIKLQNFGGIKYISNNKRLLGRFDNIELTSAVRNQLGNLDNIKASKLRYCAVDVNSNGTKVMEILTFFDDLKKIVGRFFIENGKAVRSFEYKYNGDTVKISKKAVISAQNNDLCLRPVYDEVYKVSQGNSCKKLLRSLKTEYVDLNNPDLTRRYTFSEFSQSTGNKQVFTATLTNLFDSVKAADIVDISHSDNLQLNLKDKFLKARIIGGFQGICELTKILLKEKNLDKLKIPILCRNFDDKKGFSTFGRFEICNFGAYLSFNEKFLDGKYFMQMINTAGHETEHAYQYAMIGRLGCGQFKYERDAENILGKLSAEELQEALNYKISRERHVPIDVNYVLYNDNLLEIQARNAGKTVEQQFVSEIANHNFFSKFADMQY